MYRQIKCKPIEGKNPICSTVKILPLWFYSAACLAPLAYHAPTPLSAPPAPRLCLSVLQGLTPSPPVSRYVPLTGGSCLLTSPPSLPPPGHHPPVTNITR